MSEPTDLRDEYGRRLEARTEALRALTRRDHRLSDARLAVFVAGVILAWLAFGPGVLPAYWLAAPIGLFVALLLTHDPIRRAARRAERAAEFYRRGLARLDGRWAGTGVSGERFADEGHPYAADLDLFGAGSLFERLCTARTRAGEDMLAAWLLRPAPLEAIAERHAAVSELRPRLDLREDLELLGDEVRAGVDPDALARWGRAPRAFHGLWVPAIGALLSLAAVSALVAWFTTAIGPFPFLLTLFPLGGFAWVLRGRTEKALDAVAARSDDLVLLGGLLARLEREPVTTPLLVRVHGRLTAAGGVPASRAVDALARLVHLLELKENQAFTPFACLLLWTTQLAVRVDAWRARYGPAIADWLLAVGELEALCALAAYAAENPADPFPQLVPGNALFEAEGLGHPLIAEAACVRNDLHLGGELRALIVSGSNMSGKSTLLRSVGSNAVLALAGAPVRARRLRLSPLALGATLRVQDSLQAGRSRFFAELTRLRQVVDLSRGDLPLLFLIDELFHGTNSHDRRLGAESLLRGLIDRGAIGLLTTHDLALAAITDRLAPHAANVHFEDHLENGTMTFDYLMRPGIVTHSNALALMRSIGIEL